MKKITGKIDRMKFLDYLIIFVGCVLYALSVVIFTAPNNIAPGGVIGISTMINYLFEFLPIGTLTLMLNVPLFVWGGLALGWKYLGRSLLGSAVSSVLMDFFDVLIDKGICIYTAPTLRRRQRCIPPPHMPGRGAGGPAWAGQLQSGPSFGRASNSITTSC